MLKRVSARVLKPHALGSSYSQTTTIFPAQKGIATTHVHAPFQPNNHKKKEMVNILTADEVLEIGISLIGKNGLRRNDDGKHALFLSHFGSRPEVLATLWEVLQTTDNINARIPENKTTDKYFRLFMMTHYYLKGYHVEDVVASRFEIHEQTLRTWVAYFIEKFAALINDYVVWPDEFQTEFIGSVDCVNFGTNEPRHPTLHKDKRYFDRKGGKAGLLYEVALDLWSNRVMWFNGPFPPNDGNDATVYKTRGLMERVPDGKWLVADKIYVGCDHISGHNSLDTPAVRDFKARARARQESFNARLKVFGCLRQRFRHGIAKHQTFARAVCVIVIFQMESGSPLFWFDFTLNALKLIHIIIFKGIFIQFSLFLQKFLSKRRNQILLVRSKENKR